MTTTSSSFDVEFKNFVSPCIEKFRRSRATRFAKSNGVPTDEVHVHNQVPIWFLLKRFKSQYSIRSRLFKSLSEEQKQSWLSFYDENKQLILMTNEKHKQFHDANLFDAKSGEWKNINPQVEESKILTTPPKPVTRERSSPRPQTQTQAGEEKEHKRPGRSKASTLEQMNEKVEDEIPSPSTPSIQLPIPSTSSELEHEHEHEHKKKRVRVKKNTN